MKKACKNILFLHALFGSGQGNRTPMPRLRILYPNHQMNPPRLFESRKQRKLGDSNPRYGYPYGSLANYWFQPLTQTSIRLKLTGALFLNCECKGSIYFQYHQMFLLFFLVKVPLLALFLLKRGTFRAYSIFLQQRVWALGQMSGWKILAKSSRRESGLNEISSKYGIPVVDPHS